jgi:hypothetical protein
LALRKLEDIFCEVALMAVLLLIYDSGCFLKQMLMLAYHSSYFP